MANVCSFSMRIRGTRDNCEAFLESPMSIYEIGERKRKGTEEDMMIQLDGECPWSVIGSFVENEEESLEDKAAAFQLEIEIFGYDRSEPEWLEHFHYKGEKCIKACYLNECIDSEQFAALALEERACYLPEGDGFYRLKDEFREECDWNEETGEMNLRFDMSFDDVEGEEIINDETAFFGDGDWSEYEAKEPEPVTWSEEDDLKAVEYITSLYDSLDDDTMNLIINSCFVDTGLTAGGKPDRVEFCKSVAASLTGGNDSLMRCPNFDAFKRSADDVTSAIKETIPVLKKQESRLNKAIGRIFAMERPGQLAEARDILKRMFRLQAKKAITLKDFRSNFGYDAMFLARFALGRGADDQALEEIRESIQFNHDARVHTEEYISHSGGILKSDNPLTDKQVDRFISDHVWRGCLLGDNAEYALLMAEYMLCINPEEATVGKARAIALNQELIGRGEEGPAESMFEFAKIRDADKPMIAYGYLFEGDEYPDKESKKIDRYIASHTDAMLQLLEGDDEEGFSRILYAANDLTKTFVDDRIRALDDGKHPGQLAVLLKYREEHFPVSDAGPVENPPENRETETDWKQIYKFEEADGKIRILKMKADLIETDIPGTIDGKKVEWIGKNAFKGKKSLKTVRFLGPVSEIAESAFEECAALEKIDLPEGLVFLGKRAFYNCPSLAEVRWPSTLKECSTNAFGYKPYSAGADIVPRAIRVSPDCEEIFLNNLDTIDGDVHLYIEGQDTRISCNTYAFFQGTIHFPKGRKDTSLPPIVEDADILVVVDE